MRTKVLSARIPADHWIWEEQDIRATVLLALRLYRNMDTEMRQMHEDVKQLKKATLFGEHLAEMQMMLNEIRTMLSDGVIAQPVSQPKTDPGPGTDPRLMKNIDKFLDL